MNEYRSPLPTLDADPHADLPHLDTFMHHLKRTRSKHRWYMTGDRAIRAPHFGADSWYDPISAVAELLSPGIEFTHNDTREAGVELGLTWEELLTLQASSDNDMHNDFYNQSVNQRLMDSVGLA